MRFLLSCLLFFLSLTLSAQSRWHDQFPVKTVFEPGAAQTYEVTEFEKVDNIFSGVRATVESLVRFEIVDTTAGGYVMKYSVLVNSVKKQYSPSTSILAALTEGLEQYVIIKNGSFQLDSLSYVMNQQRVSRVLDSITAGNSFDKNTTQILLRLQAEFRQGNGLIGLLRPLMLFQSYYTAGVYKKFRIDTKSTYGKIYDQRSFTGLIGNKWESTSKDSTVTLSRIFTGDPVPTARYFKPVYEELLRVHGITKKQNFYPQEMRFVDEYEFRTQPGRDFPTYLFKKNVSEYIWREVSRVEMKKW